MIIDAHCHMFTRRIVANVAQKKDMIAQLHLDTEHAFRRLNAFALEAAATINSIDACFLLPTANANEVQKENDRYLAMTNGSSRIKTFATLHPLMESLNDEISRMLDKGVPGFKFSSFTQRFDIGSHETTKMLRSIEKIGAKSGKKPVVIFDTFVAADRYFGADVKHLTTPAKLEPLVERLAGLNIIAAHMGGLTADFTEIANRLKPRPNLFLDTANACHTLATNEFIALLQIHGPQHILFGTDWPWFHYREEIPLVHNLCLEAGFKDDEIGMIMGGNAAKLFQLS